MITTITPNPSLDTTISVAELEVGEVHRVQPAFTEAAGKGVNVADALLRNGLQAQAIVLCGVAEGQRYLSLMAQQGVPAEVVDSGTMPRTNISVIEADGTTTKLNEPGFEVSAEVVESLLSAAVEAGLASKWIVAGGSLAPGLPGDFYASMARRLAQEAPACRLAIDASGAALASVLDAPGVLLKPNLEELADVWDAPIVTVEDGIGAARKIVEHGPWGVLVSLGGDGGVLVTADAVIRGTVDSPDVLRNTVGAGDSMLAGFVAGYEGSDGDLKVALTAGLAWGRAAVRTEGTGLESVEPEDINAVSIEML